MHLEVEVRLFHGISFFKALFIFSLFKALMYVSLMHVCLKKWHCGQVVKERCINSADN